MSVHEIERVRDLPLPTFERDYLNNETPVIVQGYLDDWPAMQWTLDGIKEKAGHNQVFVRRNTADEDYKVGKRYNIESMTFSEYITNIQQGNKKSQSSYLAVQNIRKALPELYSDVRVPGHVGKLHGGPYLWVARKNHYEFCHFDADDNILMVFAGCKKVRLYRASDIERLYPNPFGSCGRTVQSQVNCEHPDLERFPRFRDTECWECMLHAGEMLYFPAFWWHQVTSTETTISMNVFFGNRAQNQYITKIMDGPQWGCFRHWILNIVAQNRELASFEKVLSHLPQSLASFLMKQWHEVATPKQMQRLVNNVLEYLQLDCMPEPTEQSKHPPQLKIRGLLWRK